jgi:MFS family permease
LDKPTSEEPIHPGRRLVVAALGVTQILAWGSSYYLPAVLAQPIASDTGWPLAWVVGGFSAGLMVAGLISPYIGRTINRGGGRAVMALSSVLLGCGLALLAAAQNLPMYLAAWLVIGLGMGSGLYDAAFATLGRLYSTNARGPIAALTLFGGLASTLCWPLSAFLLEHLGWRGACLVYAAIQLLLAMPLHWLVLPPLRGHAQPAATVAGPKTPLLPRADLAKFLLTAAATALASAILAMLSVHLLTVLQAKGLELAAAVTLGAMIGPSQVGARIVQMIFASRYHPIWTKLTSALLVTLGLAMLLGGFPLLVVPLVLYGAGVGIESIVRGTLPLAIFDPASYAAIMGRIAMPSLLFQALSPWLGAILLDHGGPDFMLSVLTAMAVVNVVLVGVLWILCRSGPANE